MLALRGGGGSERAMRSARRCSFAPPAEQPVAGEIAAVGWWQALLLAFVGGVMLNLMPCVFPVLSLKLLGLTAARRIAPRSAATGSPMPPA